MKTRPISTMLVGYCVLALLAAAVGLPGGPSSAYADGTSPEPPANPGPPEDSTLDAVNPQLPNQVDRVLDVDGKQDVSLWRIAQLLVLGVI